MKKSKIAALLFFIVTAGVFAQDVERDALKLYRQRKYSEAVEVCRQEIAEMPRNMDSYSVLGWSLLSMGRYDEALAEAQKAHAISRYDHRIIEIIAEARFYRGENIKALQRLEEYAALAPEGGRIDTVYFLMGEVYVRLGEFNHADIAFTTAVYHSPNSAKWWSRLGYAREMASDYEHALEAYGQALKLNAGYAEARRGQDRVKEKMEQA